MNRLAVLRITATGLVLLAAAALVGWRYAAYVTNPWTRDGIVQGRVALVAPQVSGLVITAPLHNNSEVRAGDLLFALDSAPFEAALRQAEAELARAETLAQLAEADADRATSAEQAEPGALSRQTVQDARLRAQAAASAVAAARAGLDQTRLRLGYTRVTAPADGYVTGVTLTPGTTVAAFNPVLALIHKDGFRVEGLFRETLVSGIRPGQKALVTLMAYPDKPLSGEVESIGWGIARQNGSTSGVNEQLLPVISPTFEWIRLAQRIPVRIILDTLPPGLTLRVGETASVMVLDVSADSAMTSSALKP